MNQLEYLHCLWNASRYWEFEKLGQEEQMIEEDLIKLSLIEMHHIDIR